MDFRFLIAKRYLLSRKRISLISVITGISIAGITVGVAALIVVLSVMNGFYEVVRNLLVSFDPHVRIVAADARGIEDAESLMRPALEVPGVLHAMSYVEGRALVTHEGQGELNKVVIVRGVDPETLGGVGDVSERVIAGDFRLAREEDRPGIVIGSSLANRLGLLPAGAGRPGSAVALMSAQGIERTLTQGIGMPAYSVFTVRGLYEIEAIYDQSHVFIDLPEAQRLFRMDRRVSGIELRLDDLDSASRVKASLEEQLDTSRFTVLTWHDLQRSLYDVMQLEKWGATLILALIVVVAAFNLIGSLTMVVIEKRRDISVLRAMGVSRRRIRQIFLLEGIFIGGIGTGLGLFAGLGLVLAQKYMELVPLAQADSFIIDAYPVAIQLTDVLAISVISMGLCILAAVYPATRAAAVEPSRSIQDEVA